MVGEEEGGGAIYFNSGSPSEDIADADIVGDGFVKWDGCVNAHFANQQVMWHGCSPKDVVNLTNAIRVAYDICFGLIEAADDHEYEPAAVGVTIVDVTQRFAGN